jgi:hypothetical protein
LRLRVKRLVGGVRELAKHGPMKPEGDRGLSDEVAAMGKGDGSSSSSSSSSSGSGAATAPDPLGIRVGVPPPAQLASTLLQCAQEAEESISNAHAKLRRPLNVARIRETVQNLKGAVMMAYPAGLPDWDFVRQGLEDREQLGGTEDSKHVLEPESSLLWFAGKCMDRDQLLGKYTGSNEKVTIKARVEARGGQAPQREPAVDEDTRRKMMSLWHKKEQEQKKLDEADEDSYLNSSWANPKGFKQSALGMGEIKFRPGGR